MVLLERSPKGGAEAEPNTQGLLLRLLPQGSSEAVRLRTGLDDVCLVGEPVEHGLAEPCVGEDLRPLGVGQVSGDDDSGLFGSLRDHLEEQFGGDFGEGNQPVCLAKDTASLEKCLWRTWALAH